MAWARCISHIRHEPYCTCACRERHGPKERKEVPNKTHEERLGACVVGPDLESKQFGCAALAAVHIHTHAQVPNARLCMHALYRATLPFVKLLPLEDLLPAPLVQKVVDGHHGVNVLLGSRPALALQCIVELL